jgi:hypothetical protein
MHCGGYSAAWLALPAGSVAPPDTRLCHSGRRSHEHRQAAMAPLPLALLREAGQRLALARNPALFGSATAAKACVVGGALAGSVSV